MEDDQLEPDRPNSVTDNDAKYFPRAFGPNVRARVIVRPCFFQEHAVGLLEAEGQYQIFVTMQPGFDERNEHQPLEAQVAEYKALPVSKELGDCIAVIWRLMLNDLAQIDGMPRGLDGTTYHFSMCANGDELAGQIWSPAAGTKTGRLVAIAKAMRSYCWTEDGNWERTLREESRALLQQLTGAGH